MKVDLEHWNSNVLSTDRGDFDIDEYLKRCSPEDFNLREKLEEWRDVGVVVFESCIDISLISSLLEDIVYLDRHQKEFDLEVEHKGARYRLKDLPVPPLSDTGIKF